MTPCVTDLALERFLLDELDTPAAEREHIVACPRCRAALTDKQRIGEAYMASPAARRLADELAPAPHRRRRMALPVVAVALVAAALAIALWPPATASTREAEVLAVERAWMEAYRHNDDAALDSILANDYRLTDSFGRTSTKADDLARARTKSVEYDAYDTTNVQVRVWGDTAVVTGRSQIRGRANGEPFAYDVSFTDTLARISGRWRAVSAHVSRNRPR